MVPHQQVMILMSTVPIPVKPNLHYTFAVTIGVLVRGTTPASELKAIQLSVADMNANPNILQGSNLRLETG